MPLPARETLLIAGALVLERDGAGWRTRTADVLVEDGRIARIGQITAEEAPVGARRLEGAGKLLAPGLVNAHGHSPMTLCPGTMDGANHPAFMWLSQADTSGRTPREVYVSAMLGCMQMLLTGTTAVIDHFPEQGFGAEDVDAVAQAYVDSGMRAVVALRIFDGSYDDIAPAGGAGLGNAGPLAPPSLDVQQALVEGAIDRWHGHAGRLQVFPAPSNPARCSDALLTMCRDMAERRAVGIHTHLLETEVQIGIARRRYGTTMVEHLDRLGLLGPSLTCAHCNWLSEGDIQLLAASGTVVAHNPESNQKLGSGVAPIPELMAAGATIALGTDGANHNDNLIMHESMKLAALLHRPRLTDRRRWILAGDALRMATEGGARAMRLEGTIGRIAEGRAADLVLYDLSAPWWFPLNSPVEQMVHAETGASVETVIVDGRVLVEDRRLTAFDGAAIKAEASEMLTAIRARNAALVDATRSLAEQF